MNLKGHDLATECVAVSFETGLLRFACTSAEVGQMCLLILNPQDPDYLAAIAWAISNNKLQGVQ